MTLRFNICDYFVIIFVFLIQNKSPNGFACAQTTCETPDFQPGYCLPYKNCEKYLTQLQTRFFGNELGNFLKQSRCNNDQNVHICCDELTIDPTAFYGVNAYVSSLNRQGLEILSSSECGNVTNFRIAYGEEAKLGEFPWMALIEYDMPNQPFACGGSLISSRYVLTAAHCLVVDDKITGVILGEHNLDTDPDCQQRGRRVFCSPPRERFGIAEIIPHPEYRKHHIGYDIGLIKLSSPAIFKKHITPICLPITPFTLQMQDTFLIAGWGTTETGVTSRLLLKAAVSHQARSVCEQTFRRQRITSHHLCIGGDGPIESCKGDSGGPLFITTNFTPSKARFVQYGAVSFGGKDCSALQKYPSVYSNVTEFMPWITSNIKE